MLLKIEAASEDELKAKRVRIEDALKPFDLAAPARFTSDSQTVSRYWAMRSGIFPAVGGARETGTTCLIEDIAVPVDRLADATEELRIKVTRTSAAADYALRISGNSMEPEFCDGDILLVREQSELDVGELGIFIGDGEGYFKRFMGQTLRSLNPAYKDIPISSFGEFRCCGKVIGKTNV